jgi:large subunit ribosomal protein L22
MPATQSTAKLSSYRQSPRKVRLVADLVRGKSLEIALRELGALPRRSAPVFVKLFNSAAANAKVAGLTGELMVKELRVDKGAIMKRMMPRAHGRGFPINKRTSHITVVLAEKATGNVATASLKAPKDATEEAKTTKTVKATKTAAK